MNFTYNRVDVPEMAQCQYWRTWYCIMNLHRLRIIFFTIFNVHIVRAIKF